MHEQILEGVRPRRERLLRAMPRAGEMSKAQVVYLHQNASCRTPAGLLCYGILGPCMQAWRRGCPWLGTTNAVLLEGPG